MNLTYMFDGYTPTIEMLEIDFPISVTTIDPVLYSDNTFDARVAVTFQSEVNAVRKALVEHPRCIFTRHPRPWGKNIPYHKRVKDFNSSVLQQAANVVDEISSLTRAYLSMHPLNAYLIIHSVRLCTFGLERGDFYVEVEAEALDIGENDIITLARQSAIDNILKDL